MCTAWEYYNIITDSNPYRACLEGLDEHPHYKDCSNCDRARFCDIYAWDETCRLSRELVKEATALSERIKPKKIPLP